MKKLFITAAALLVCAVAGAQLVSVQSVERLGSATGDKAVLSPDGQFVVVNTATSLKKVNVADGAESVIVEGEGLYNVRVSGDGNTVVYSKPSYNDKHMRFVSLEAANLADGTVKTLVKPSRKLNHGFIIADGTVNAIENGKLRTTVVNGGKTVKAPVASISYGHLQVTQNGKTVTIDPQGRGSYIWPSVSPDGKRVCYWLVGAGCFTCNLDGSDVKQHGRLVAPVWAGNSMLVGQDVVEGTAQALTASSIVALDVNTNKVQKLTDDSVIATFPSASADGSRIAFTTPEGAVYLINLTK